MKLHGEPFAIDAYDRAFNACVRAVAAIEPDRGHDWHSAVHALSNYEAGYLSAWDGDDATAPACVRKALRAGPTPAAYWRHMRAVILGIGEDMSGTGCASTIEAVP